MPDATVCRVVHVSPFTHHTSIQQLPPLRRLKKIGAWHLCLFPPGAPLRRGGVFAQGREAKGGAPLHSVDPCSFLTRVPGGAGYKMLAAPRKGLVRLPRTVM